MQEDCWYGCCQDDRKDRLNSRDGLNPEKTYDRMGVDNEVISILGVKVPSLTIPVKPGRNLAVILEVATMNNRQKKMGYNAAQELLENLGLNMEGRSSKEYGFLGVKDMLMK